MPKRRTKRSQTIYLTLVYMTMTILVVCIVGLLTLLTLGYDFNTKSGKIEQGGLIQLDSRPAGASVMFNGQRLGSRTYTKLTAASGSHDITMQRAGYRDWQKHITLRHGEVLWFNYVVLVPNDVQSKDIATYHQSSPVSSLASPNSKWLIVAAPDRGSTLDRYEIGRDDAKMTPISLPPAAYTAPAEGKTQAFEPMLWMNDNRTVIVRHIYNDGGIEWLTVNSENPSESRNLTKQLGVELIQLQPNASDSNRLYVITAAHELREIKLHDMSLSRVIAERVASIAQADSGTISYQTIADEHGARIIGYYTDGAASPRVLDTVTSSGQLAGIITKYYGDHYITVVNGDMMTVTKSNLPASDSAAAITRQPVASMPALPNTTLSANTSQRFIMLQNNDEFAVYDFELRRHTTTKLDGTPASPVRWIDDHHLVAICDGVLTMYEFDGENVQRLANHAMRGAVTFARDGKYIYFMAQHTPTTQQITRLTMIID